MRRVAIAWAASLFFASACSERASDGRADASTAPGPPAATVEPALSPSASSASTPPPASSAVDAGAPLPGRTDGCSPGMVRIEGEHCPAVIEECVEHHPEWVKHHGEPGVAERCLRYREPTRCASPRVHLAYCMDRYEYPNVKGEVPPVLTSWLDAGKACAADGKRLCTQREFTFACAGPEMLPYAYGYVRDPSKCNQDRGYVLPDHRHPMKHYDACVKDERCAQELARLDQREPAGTRAACVSWAGVFDLNGNVNEWVVRPDEKPPHRSGLMGGWWGPIRSRCRAITTFHPEDDYGYEVGFRCCADVAP